MHFASNVCLFKALNGHFGPTKETRVIYGWRKDAERPENYVGECYHSPIYHEHQLEANNSKNLVHDDRCSIRIIWPWTFHPVVLRTT